MTYVEDTAYSDTVKVEFYPDEFKPLLKLINRALANSEVMRHITEEEAEIISPWYDDFQSLTLEHGV